MPSSFQGGPRLSLALSALSLILAGGFASWLAPLSAQPQPKDPVPAKRVPWTTSRVVGSPDPPPPFKVVRAFPKLKFNNPLLMARCPGSDRFFVGEFAGVLHSFRDTPDAK